MKWRRNKIAVKQKFATTRRIMITISMIILFFLPRNINDLFKLTKRFNDTRCFTIQAALCISFVRLYSFYAKRLFPNFNLTWKFLGLNAENRKANIARTARMRVLTKKEKMKNVKNHKSGKMNNLSQLNATRHKPLLQQVLLLPPQN